MAEDNLTTIANCPKELLLLQAVVSKIFRDVAESVSADEFSDSWTILKQKKRKSSQLLHASMVDTLHEAMVSRLNKFIVEDDLVEKFNVLQKLSEESSLPEDHIAWRPPGDVAEHLRSVDAVQIRECHQELEEYLTKMDAENQELMEQIAKGRAAAKQADQKAEDLLKQQKHVRLQFEKKTKQIENDIIRING